MATIYFTRRETFDGSYLSLVGIDKADERICRATLEEYVIVSGDIEEPVKSQRAKLAAYRRDLKKAGNKIVIVSNEQADNMRRKALERQGLISPGQPDRNGA